VQEIRGISLVFREMWDSTAFHCKFFGFYGHIGLLG
jgi:hypothetical protein